MTRDQMIARFCALQRVVTENIIGYDRPNDCFCRLPEYGGQHPQPSDKYFQNSGAALEFIESLVAAAVEGTKAGRKQVSKKVREAVDDALGQP